MSNCPSENPLKTTPKITSVHPQVSMPSSTMQKVVYKSNTLASKNPQTTSPIQIGTRGTVGALIMREIEYFSRLELGNNNIVVDKPCHQVTNTASKSKLGSSFVATKRSKKGRSKLIPRMCSMVEVAENSRPNANYMILKADMKKLHA